MKTLGCNPVQTVVCNNKDQQGQHSPSASRQQSSWRRVSPLTCGGVQKIFSDYQTLWFWSRRQEPSWLQDRPAPLERPLRPPGNKYHQHLIQEKVVKTSYRRITWCALVSAFPVWLVATIFSASSSSWKKECLKRKLPKHPTGTSPGARWCQHYRCGWWQPYSPPPLPPEKRAP